METLLDRAAEYGLAGLMLVAFMVALWRFLVYIEFRDKQEAVRDQRHSDDMAVHTDVSKGMWHSIQEQTRVIQELTRWIQKMNGGG